LESSGWRLSETTRKAVHLATAAGIPLLLLLPRPTFLLLTVASIPITLLLGPGLLARFARDGEGWRRFAFAVLSFPLSVLILLIAFPRFPAAAAAAWALLAIGDGAASMAGSKIGGPALPWNDRKSFAGSGAFLAAGLPAAGLAWYAAGGSGTAAAAMAVVAGPVLIAAMVESLPSRLGDNLPIALAAGIPLGFIAEFGGGEGALLVSRALPAVLITGATAAAGVASNAFDRRGALAGALLGGGVYLFAGAAPFASLALFVLLGSAAGRLRGDRSGPRSARHAVANLVVASFAAFLAWLCDSPAIRAALIASIGAALADTLSSEIGLRSRSRPRLIVGWRLVPAGTDGGVTPIGTAAGGAGSLLITLSAWGLGYLPFSLFVPVFFAGFAGTIIDSLLGATLERARIVGNEEVNFLSTLAAALAAGLVVLGLGCGTD